MEAQPDFKELLKLFNEKQVNYVIAGAYALAFHGFPRYTGDIDIYVKPDPSNAKYIIEALESFGFKLTDLEQDDFCKEETVIQLGVPPIRIDIITSLTGLSWEDVYNSKVKGKYGDIDVFYLGRDQLVVNKKAIGRKKDLADLELLGEE